MLDLPFIEKKTLSATVQLPASKSISHRYLMIQALAEKDAIDLQNISNSNDTFLLQKALNHAIDEVDFEDAGTPMRFFLAYAALKDLHLVINGNASLKARPLAPLVDALSQLGCRINYLEKEGCLPLSIEKGIDLNCDTVEIDSEMSSQFLSALLLIGPYLNNGLNIISKGQLNSQPYIDLTIDSMLNCGVPVETKANQYFVPKAKYSATTSITIEADWSAAAFVLAWTTARKSEIEIPALSIDSIQGDKVSKLFYKSLGVVIKENKDTNGISVISNDLNLPKQIQFDFTHTPDMFPVIAATCAYLKINAHFTGVKNLMHKESNRIEAMRSNLLQVGANLNSINDNELLMDYVVPTTDSYAFKSYEDHRIAMACSIFAFEKNITIDNASVVQKSFPDYWHLFLKMAYES
jgi:3-phosphoshikimate 1-carboxyvinyltransferase